MTASPGRGAASAPVINAPTQRVRAAGADFVYRELGADSGDALPLVALTHLGANLDSWDPEVVDPLAEDRRVLLIGYRGVGGSSGAAQQSFEAAADDVVAVIRALGVERVDLFGQSMGGMVAQAVLERAPQLVDRVVLAGSGPRGGPGLVTMGGVMIRGILRGVLTATDPIALLFFTRTPNGRSAAKALAARLTRRRVDRDSAVTLGVVRRQLGAVRRWGEEPPADSLFPHRALIVHGDGDRLVPPVNADLLRARFTDARLVVLPDSGHGVVPQNRRAVVDTVRSFLRR